jgi:hypothetical protein
MLTITNNLPTHLVVPGGAGEKLTLKIAPGGEAKVEKITSSVKDAETKGIVSIGYPPAEKTAVKNTKTKVEE